MHHKKLTHYQRQLIALSPQLKALIYAKIENYHDTEDLLQNTLLKLFDLEKKFDIRKGPLPGFAFTICRREIADFFRRRDRSRLVFRGELEEHGTVCDDTACLNLDGETIFHLLDDKKRTLLLEYHSGKTKRTSTERNKAMRALHEITRKATRLEREGFI